MATTSDICVFLSRSAQCVSIFQDNVKDNFQARLLRDRSLNQFGPHAGWKDMTPSSF